MKKRYFLTLLTIITVISYIDLVDTCKKIDAQIENSLSVAKYEYNDLKISKNPYFTTIYELKTQK